MLLQNELDAVRERCRETTPRHINSVRQEAIDDLVASGAAKRAVRAGDHLPPFRLRDADGEAVSSLDLFGGGRAVIIFYRGRWCPYCTVDLRAMEGAAQAIRSTGASIVAISPQSTQESRATERMHDLSFPSLVDHGGKVARAFGLRWKLSRALQAAELEAGLDLAAVNAEPSWTLTMPARYVIGADGIVEYADVNADYTRRGDPAELFPVLSDDGAYLTH